MNLQKRTIERYRLLYPNDTLREVSERTGIQITRVFRLFSGKTMKVMELEAFEKVVNDKLKENPNHYRLTKVLEEAATVLTNEELGRILDHIERKNRARSFGRLYFRAVVDDAYIA